METAGNQILLSLSHVYRIMSVMIDATAFLPLFTHDRIMASIYGGVLAGAGIGILLAAVPPREGAICSAGCWLSLFPIFPSAG
jgi:hypothetical protein